MADFLVGFIAQTWFIDKSSPTAEEEALIEPLDESTYGEHYSPKSRTVASLRGEVAQGENYFAETPNRDNQVYIFYNIRKTSGDDSMDSKSLQLLLIFCFSFYKGPYSKSCSYLFIFFFLGKIQ